MVVLAKYIILKTLKISLQRPLKALDTQFSPYQIIIFILKIFIVTHGGLVVTDVTPLANQGFWLHLFDSIGL